MDFHWIIEGKLAGSAQPGLLRSTEEDMEQLKQYGIDVVVTLTEDPPDPNPSLYGFRSVHFPIPDMGIPHPRRGAQLCHRLLADIRRGEGILLHCRAGKGRTGTMLAACLITMGYGAEEALGTVRRVNRNYVESTAQQNFLKHYEEHLLEAEDQAHGPQAWTPFDLRRTLSDD